MGTDLVVPRREQGRQHRTEPVSAPYLRPGPPRSLIRGPGRGEPCAIDREAREDRPERIVGIRRPSGHGDEVAGRLRSRQRAVRGVRVEPGALGIPPTVAPDRFVGHHLVDTAGRVLDEGDLAAPRRTPEATDGDRVRRPTWDLDDAAADQGVALGLRIGRETLVIDDVAPGWEHTHLERGPFDRIVRHPGDQL